MASGKGGKSDPAKIKKDSSVTRYVLKVSQAKAILRVVSRMRISQSAAEALVYALTYVLIEVIDGAHNACVSDQKKKILPKHINQCIAIDSELSVIGYKWLIKSGGATGYLKNEDLTTKKRKNDE